MMKLNLLLAAISCVPFFALARHGGVDGGGGKSVVCRDSQSKIVSAQTLDLYEAEQMYGLTLTKFSQSYPLIIKQIKKKIAPTMEQPEVHLFPLFDRVQKIMRFVPSQSVIEPIDDAAAVVLPKNCQLEQLARYIDDSTLVVSSEIWNALDQTNQAALVAHEALYRLERYYGATDSRRARKAVAHYFSDFEFKPLQEGVSPQARYCSANDPDTGNPAFLFTYQPNSFNPAHTTLSFSMFEGRFVHGKMTSVLPITLPWNFYCASQDCLFAGGDITSDFEGGKFISLGIQTEVNQTSVKQQFYFQTNKRYFLNCFPTKQEIKSHLEVSSGLSSNLRRHCRKTC